MRFDRAALDEQTDRRAERKQIAVQFQWPQWEIETEKVPTTMMGDQRPARTS
ncbi:hypothetical protein [Nonomuraea sediminis]|uniref:hypothetical protein n=1 Tax=Nonomuraea sediminis TaxID=2835864 RepID=UPI001BDCF267|nr:hypothetical protein [Nonomuraea sediminis]